MNLTTPIAGGIMLLAVFIVFTLLCRLVKNARHKKPTATSRSTKVQQCLRPDEIVQNQDFDFSTSPPCPHCNSKDVAKMIYGKPALTRQIIEGLESGKIISGGCMIHDGAPQWHCNHCNKGFDNLKFAPATTDDQ